MSTDVADECVLDLSHHCIETAARHAFRVARDELLRGDDDAVGQRFRLLEELLRHTDFATLRAENPHLAGGHPMRVRVYRSSSGQVTWSVVP